MSAARASACSRVTVLNACSDGSTASIRSSASRQTSLADRSRRAHGVPDLANGCRLTHPMTRGTLNRPAPTRRIGRIGQRRLADRATAAPRPGDRRRCRASDAGRRRHAGVSTCCTSSAYARMSPSWRANSSISVASSSRLRERGDRLDLFARVNMADASMMLGSVWQHGDRSHVPSMQIRRPARRRQLVSGIGAGAGRGRRSAPRPRA